MHLQVYFRPYLKVENLKQPFRLHDTKYKQTFPRNFSYLSFSNRGSINSFLVFVCSDKSLIHRITRKNAKKPPKFSPGLTTIFSLFTLYNNWDERAGEFERFWVYVRPRSTYCLQTLLSFYWKWQICANRSKKLVLFQIALSLIDFKKFAINNMNIISIIN